MKKVLILIVCTFFAITASGGRLIAADKKNSQPTKVWSAKESQKDYRISAGDILEITTWKEPDLSRPEVLVRTDGKISFPLLNDVQAAGLTPLEMKSNMEKGLKNFVSSPFVTITIRAPESQKIYVLGEVIRTGEYPLTKNLTVLQAFSLAGGFTEWASKKEIILLRNEGGKDKIYRINYKEIIKGEGLGQNIALKADDTIIIP